ncbi:DUF934 domain-containing protein [Polynucleobacter sp. JS-JIR-II-b4]|uniref:DUF934 domain-containing protein n=1 Tax=Polynucleobacter sp. JS-JIR-II-b4 TaxID=1758390 RepID=UPI001BFD9F73|nr:DUF934 domain-containing protein [Polynucleobacter sp. JS-JIR-II-b4]QWE02873.1 DUF934 domain-containing protein [Polynucleobacter sp. JS-JIR-II-b4]
MSDANSTPSSLVQSHDEVLVFPKGGNPSLTSNKWQVWNGSQDEGGLPALDLVSHGVLVPLVWWIEHHHEMDVIAKAKNGQIGVWFAADDDILKHAELIEAGKQYWPLVAAYFPLFRDGRSFSTAALLRERLGWTKEIRMIGDVLIDQLLQGARVGFDSFALRNDQDLGVALKQFDLYSVTTQNSWRDKRTLLDQTQ